MNIGPRKPVIESFAVNFNLNTPPMFVHTGSNAHLKANMLTSSNRDSSRAGTSSGGQQRSNSGQTTHTG